MILTATGLMVPETIGRVFYSIPKVVVPQNLGPATYHWWKNIGGAGGEKNNIFRSNASFI